VFISAKLKKLLNRGNYFIYVHKTNKLSKYSIGKMTIALLSQNENPDCSPKPIKLAITIQ
jgi:hypothetical protein